MRFLRMLSNSAIAGALAAAYLTIVVLHLNPSLPLGTDVVIPLALVLAVVYGLAIAAAFFVLIVLRQLAANDQLSPGWLSVRLLSWLCTLAASAAAVVMWLNFSAYAGVLPPQTVSRMAAGAIALTASAVVFLLIAFAHRGRRGGRVSAVLLIAMMIMSLAAPLTARGPALEQPLPARPTAPLAFGPAQPTGRVVALAFDGASLEVISPAVAEGRLPNFGRILDGGAVAHLATLRPTQVEPVWSAAMTGMLPAGNGIRASALYRVRFGGPVLTLLPDYCFSQSLIRVGLLEEHAHTGESLHARPLWSILSDNGISVGIIGFPMTHPAPRVNGYIVSDELHRVSPSPDQERDAVSPSSVLADVRAALDAEWRGPHAALASFDATPQEADARPDPAPVAGDRMHLQLMRALERLLPARVLAVRFPGIDAVGHSFLRFSEPGPLGDTSDAERRRYGRVLADYYGFIDAIVGEALASLGPDDLLLVVSGFGMEPLSPGKRVLEQLVGDARVSGTHERAPDGFLLAFGAAVEPGRPARAALVDLTPTLLYYLGLPVGRDMDGFARTDLFRDAFTGSRPITFIPSYGR